jgi:kynurenine formamidase
MPAIIEISGELEPGLWDYNGLDLGGAHMPPFTVTRIASIAEHGFDAHSISLSTLSGTYTETGAHLIAEAPTVDQLAVRDLIRPAKILRLGELGPRSLIRAAELERADPGVQPGEALIIDTGWGMRWNTPGYVSDAPAFSATTLEWFLAQPFSILALDTPVMECQWCGPGDAGELLRPLYERGMILIAPVVKLDQIKASSGTLISLPLPVKGVASVPGRVVFVEHVDWSAALKP